MEPAVFMLGGMGVQIAPGGLVASVSDTGELEMSLSSYLLRLDLWTVWLEVGCIQAGRAAEATGRLSAELEDGPKAAALIDELQQSVVAVAALTFAVDGFYGVLQEEMGRHPDSDSWRAKQREGKRSVPRHRQIAETLRYHLKLGPVFSQQVSTVLKELFEFRGRAVHPNAQFVSPNYRPEINNAVHPHLVTFSGPHAVQCRALVLTLLDRFVARAEEKAGPEVDRGWLVRGREELDRLLPLYRVPGDDELPWQSFRAD